MTKLTSQIMREFNGNNASQQNFNKKKSYSRSKKALARLRLPLCCSTGLRGVRKPGNGTVSGQASCGSVACGHPTARQACCYARTSRIGVSSYSLYATHYRASGRVYSQLESRLGMFRQS